MKVRANRMVIAAQITIIGLTILLRVSFFATSSKIVPAFDTATYWGITKNTRNALCESIKHCTPQEIPIYSINQIVTAALFDRHGITALWMGATLTVLPLDLKTIYGVISLMDGINTLLIMHILSRLKLPTWVALSAGLLHALYVPGIVQSGSFLQQFPQRFWFTAAVWCAVVIWTTTEPRVVRSTVIRLMAIGLLAGYTTLTLRSVIWILPAIIIGSALFDRAHRYAAKVARMGMVLMLITILLVGILSPRFFRGFSLETNADLTNPLTTTLLLSLGFAAEGESDLTSIISYPYFWADDNWISSSKESLFSAVRNRPFEVLGRWLQSAVSNWRYPDYAYLQTFILDFRGQALQHGLYVALSIVGLAWLLGGQGARRYAALIIVILAAFSTAIFALISVEPRRLGLLFSLLAMVAAVGIKGILDFLRARSRLIPILTLCGMILMWCLPLDLALGLIPLPAEGGYLVLTALRLILTAIFSIFLLRFWQRQIPRFYPWFSGLFLGMVGIALTILLIQDEDRWRWIGGLPQRSKINQTVTDFQLPPEQNAWVIVDVYPPEAGAELILRVNGTVIKPAGETMSLWEAGDPPRFDPYDIFGSMANTPITRQMWSAYQVPSSLLAGSVELIEVETVSPAGVVIGGDYVTAPDQYYGPSLIPWDYGHSLYRWQWNGADPRIPMNQRLNGSYTSAYLDPAGASLNTDLTPGFPKHTGRYRVYLVSLPKVKIVDGLLVGKRPPLESIKEIQ